MGLVINEGMSFNLKIGEAFKSCEVLGTFKDTKNNRMYIIYTDYEKDCNNSYPIYGAEIINIDNHYKIININDEKIIRVMNAVLSKSAQALR